jgi:hypothetical protein
VQATRESHDVEVFFWSTPEPADYDDPSGAAAAFAVVAFMSFVMGLGVAAVFTF